VGLYSDLTHQEHISRSAILALSRQSDVRWKLSDQNGNVNRPQLYIKCQNRWHSIRGMKNLRFDHVIGSTVGLYTDLTHQGHMGRLAISAMSRRSDVRWKLSDLSGKVYRLWVHKKCQIKSHSIGGMKNVGSDHVIGSTVGLYTDLTHQGHIKRLAILAISRQSDVKCKLSDWKCNVNRP
jgi:hypothetical protein